MDAALFFLSIFGITTVSGAALFKAYSQRRKDEERTTYELVFPGDLKEQQVEAFLTAISGATGMKYQFTGSTSYVFELHATQGRIRAFMRLPYHEARGVLEQMNGHIPGMAVAEAEEPPKYNIRYAVEVGMSSRSKPISVPSAHQVSTSILKSIDSLKADETIVIQHVLSPMQRQRPPQKGSSDEFNLRSVFFPREATQDELNARRKKVEQANFQGVLRVGAKGSTEVQDRFLVKNVSRQFRATNTAFNRWVVMRRKSESVVSDIRHARSPVFNSHAQLSVAELAAVLGWRFEGAQVAGIPSGRARMLPAPTGVPVKGRVFGQSNHPATARQLAVTTEESCKHWHIVGRTGAGKTALAANLAAQDMFAGRGLVVIDPKFDLFNAVLNYVPSNRLKDVVVFDVNDTANPVGFNILTQGSPQTVASEVQAIFDHIYRDSGSVRMPETLYHLLITLMTTTAATTPLTFVDIVPLMAPTTREEQMFAKAVKAGIKDPYIKGWWENIDRLRPAERDKYFQSLRSRIWQLNSRAEIRNIIGQSESSIDLTDIVKNKKILLVNLKGLPEEVAALTGSLIVNNLWHVAKSGYTSEENPFMVYLDEFQHFVHTPISVETLLAEGRSFGLSMHLMHQGLDQLDGRKQVAEGVMNNAVNKIVFQRGRRDASTFAAEFGAPVTDEDMKKLGKFEFMARVASEDGISAPLTGKTMPPLEPYGFAKQARELSRGLHGRPAAEVEAATQARRRIGGSAEKPLAEIGDEDL